MDYNTFAGGVKKTNATVTKLDIAYPHADCRCWSAIINQGKENIIVTHAINRSDYGTQVFDIFTSSKIITDVEPEDIFDTIELLVFRTPATETSTEEIA